MNYDKIFNKIQEQYKKIFEFMESAAIGLSCIKETVSYQTANYKKMDKRIARIEAKLKLDLIDLEQENEPKSEMIELKQGD